MMFNQFELLTVAEAAVMLRASSSFIYNLIHKGKLKVTKRGRSFLISKTSILNYTEQIINR